MSQRREPTPDEERREGIDPAIKGGHIGGQIGGRKGGEAALRSEKVSAAQFAMYMKGIDFPASKDELVEHARSNKAPENVMQLMRKLPERQYHRANEVTEEFGKLK